MVKRAFRIGSGLALGLLLLWVLGWLSLPVLMEKALVHLMTGILPDQPFSCTVRRVGMSEADLETMVLGNPEEPALRIDSLRLNYSLRGLFARHLERLALGGVVVQGQWRDGRFAFAGFSQREAGAGPNSGDPDFSLPGTIGEFSIAGGLLRGKVRGRMEQWPFRLKLGRENSQGPGDVAAPLTGALTLYPEGQEQAFAFRAAVVDQSLSFKVGAKDFPLASVADFLGGELAGRLQFGAEGRIGLHPIKVRALDFHCAIAQFSLGNKGAGRHLEAAGAEDSPLLFSLTVAEDQWHFKSNGLVVHSPVELTFAELEGTGVLAEDGGRGTGSLLLDVRQAGQKKPGVRARAEFQAAFSHQGGWLFALQAASEAAQNSRLPLAFNRFDVELKKEPGTALALAAGISGLALRQEKSWELLVPEFKISALLPELPPGSGGEVQLRVPELVGRAGQTELRLAGLTAQVALRRGSQAPGAIGQVRLARVMLNGQDLGGLRLTAEREAEELLFAGSHKSKLLEGVVLKVKGRVGISPMNGLHAALELSAPRQKFTALDPGRFFRAGPGLTLAGEFTLEAAGAFARGAKSGELRLQLNNTRLELPNREIAVSGINLTLAAPDLFQLRSLPAQPLTFAAAQLGDLAFADGEFAFQIESPTSLLLESGGFAWCDGHVYSQALRLRSTSKDYEVTLFGDRLRLAGLLAQFGVEGAEGEGTLNGRIPMSVVDGRVRFVEGFLYSSPGEGGSIRIGKVGLLTAGVPKNTAQFSQLDFTGEALKNFHYNWARLRLHSEGEELLLQINLDGQPAQPIPFKYNSQLGSFSRLQAGEAGGIIHPIRLDINLRLPLQKILEYGGGMQKLYEMTQ